MSESTVSVDAPEDNLKQKLVMRVAFAGVLIAMLLAALALIDYLGQPGEEPAASGPSYTTRVPVAKKEVTQPVKPALPEPPAPAVAETAAATPAPAEGAPAAPSAIGDAPPKPEVSAQPALPANQGKAAAMTPAPRTTRTVPETPAEGTSASTSVVAEKPAPQETRSSAPATVATPAATPAPPRLFSGFAVQAGVFSDAQRAEELRAKLTLNGIPSTMEARVQVGPFKTREEAEAARQKMKALGIDGILLPPKGTRR